MPAWYPGGQRSGTAAQRAAVRGERGQGKCTTCGRFAGGRKNLTPRPPSLGGKGEKEEESSSPPRCGEGLGEGFLDIPHAPPDSTRRPFPRESHHALPPRRPRAPRPRGCCRQRAGGRHQEGAAC